MEQDLRAHLDQRPMTTFQWSVIAVCMALNMIDGFDVLVMAFTASAVSAHWKLSGSELGFLLSAGLFGMAAGSLLLAPMADKLGRRPLILLCLAVSGLGMLASAWSQTPMQLAVLRVITGLGVGGILACSNVIASEYASLRWRSLAVTLQSTGYALGATIGGSIAVWLLAHHGWRSVFMFGGCSTLAVLVLAWFALPESLDFLLVKRPANALQRLNGLIRKMGLPALGSLPQAVAAGSGEGKRMGPLQLLSPKLLRPTLLVWLSFFSVMFGFYFVMSWTPKLLAASGLTPEQGVTTGVLLSLGGILGATLLGLLAARFAIHRALAVFMLVTAVLLCFLVGSSGALWMSYTLAFLIGVFVNACVAGLYAIAPVVYGSDVRATGVGWGIGIGRIGAIVSPLVAGGLLDAAWSPDQLYLGYGLAFVLAAVIVSMHRIAGPQAADRRAASETVAAAH
ncbi:MFS transporter [Comamonas thiooxydans]|uniref:MFS transporter n=1 Tax=Comamonas thiooxydans TaxID=363952 RepID=A0A0E3C8G2_9BURK|nr:MULTISPECIES: MFS transporter [Comamonas]KGH00717.1 MFS transporter [Comamonas thiooxydans]GAO72503.1 MFS transporter [Comamonas sp. E6]